jgi:hypothetical protein
VLLPAGRRLQLFYRRAFLAAEQVEAGLSLSLFPGCGSGTAVSANGNFSARLPFRRLRFFAWLLRIQSALALSALDRLCTSRFINRIRFGHRVVLQWDPRLMRGAPTTQSPAIEARRSRPLAQCFLSNQRRQHERSLRRRSPVRMCESRRRLNHASLRQVNDRPTAASAENFLWSPISRSKREILSSFKATDSSTGPRVRILLGPPTNRFPFDNSASAELSHHHLAHQGQTTANNRSIADTHLRADHRPTCCGVFFVIAISPESGSQLEPMWRYLVPWLQEVRFSPQGPNKVDRPPISPSSI